MNRETVGFGEIAGSEANPAFHQAREEVEVTSQAIEFGNEECGVTLSACIDGCGQLGSVPLSGACLYFRELINQLKALARN